MPNELESKVVEVDGVDVHVRMLTKAAPTKRPPVVLVHGLSISSTYMVPTARLLAHAFPVYAPDLPGFGRSHKPKRTLDIMDHANMLESWMDEMNLGRAILVGNSLGCQVIIEFAQRHPARVLSAVLVGPTMDPDKRSGRLLWDVLRDAVKEKPSLIMRHAVDDVRAGFVRIVRTFGYGLEHPVQRKLRRVLCPTLVVRGQNDPIIPQRWARRVADLLPRGRFVEIPGPHALNYSAPDRLVEVMMPFLLQSLETESRPALGQHRGTTGRLNRSSS